MMGHKICFYGEIWLIIPKLSLLLPLIWSTAFSILKEYMVSNSIVKWLFHIQFIKQAISEFHTISCEMTTNVKLCVSDDP